MCIWKYVYCIHTPTYINNCKFPSKVPFLPLSSTPSPISPPPLPPPPTIRPSPKPSRPDRSPFSLPHPLSSSPYESPRLHVIRLHLLHSIGSREGSGGLSGSDSRVLLGAIGRRKRCFVGDWSGYCGAGFEHLETLDLGLRKGLGFIDRDP